MKIIKTESYKKIKKESWDNTKPRPGRPYRSRTRPGAGGGNFMSPVGTSTVRPPTTELEMNRQLEKGRNELEKQKRDDVMMPSSYDTEVCDFCNETYNPKNGPCPLCSTL